MRISLTKSAEMLSKTVGFVVYADETKTLMGSDQFEPFSQTYPVEHVLACIITLKKIVRRQMEAINGKY